VLLPLAMFPVSANCRMFGMYTKKGPGSSGPFVTTLRRRPC
jgi:hypothetical protein